VKKKIEWVRDIELVTTILERKNGGKSEKNMLAVWTQDSEVSNCTNCNSKFTLTKRRHHCRRCGKVVCGACSSNKHRLVDGAAEVRVCTLCFKEFAEQERVTLRDNQNTPNKPEEQK